MYKQTCDYVCTCCVQGVFKEKGLILIEISEGVTINDIKQATGIRYTRSRINKSLYDLFIVVIFDY